LKVNPKKAKKILRRCHHKKAAHGKGGKKHMLFLEKPKGKKHHKKHHKKCAKAKRHAKKALIEGKPGKAKKILRKCHHKKAHHGKGGKKH